MTSPASTHHNESHYDLPRQSGRQVASGAALLLLSPLVGLIFLVLAGLTANPCGMFADGCSDYGQTTGFSNMMVLFMIVGPLAMIVAGIVRLCTAQTSANNE